MGFLEFLSHLAWPLVVAGALYGFRESISQKLKSAAKVTGYGVSAEFLQKVEEQTKLVQTITTDLPPLLLEAKKEKPELTAQVEAPLEELKAANSSVRWYLSKPAEERPVGSSRAVFQVWKSMFPDA